MLAKFLAGMVLATAAHAADLTPPEILSLIRTRMAQTLARLPDYTCGETIERSVRARGSDQFEIQDLLRVDVAFLGGRELYAWPGSPRFGDQNILDMVPDGSIGTGNYGALGIDVFVTDAAAFTFDGRSVESGRSQVRFQYRVPLERSKYAIHFGALGATVSYHGWFTADAGTHDVIAFQIEADEIPRNLDTLKAVEHVEYARSRIGAGDYLLPAASETLLVDLAGKTNRNRISFGRCRQYTGESTVTFGEPGVIPAAGPPLEPPQPLPAGVELRLRLDAPIERGVTAIGDVVTGTITQEVRQPVAIPKGARVSLRITRMTTRLRRRDRVEVVAFELLNVNAGGRQYDPVEARLERAGGAGLYDGSSNGISFRSQSLRIPAGLEMTWRTSR